MRSTIFAVLSMAVVFIVLPIHGLGQEARVSIQSLTWLSGCWEMNMPEKKMLGTEQWMKPAGGMMIGAGRTVKDGKVLDYEFLRIIEEADGVFYIAKPTGNKDETKFKLVRTSAWEVVFENPAHDFPQRVMYKLNGDKLNARIEGTKDGKTRGVDFPYTRSACN
jgi:hypothetical protein